MKAITIMACSCLWLISLTGAAKAETLFLPVALQRSASSATYQIDHVRLWHLSENHPAYAQSEDRCGRQHKLQVHVFDRSGDSGGQSRLNGVIVQVIQWSNGQRTEEFRTTGLPGAYAGVVEFELQDQAEVRIFTDVDGHPVVSQVAFVTTTPQHIATEWLSASGYCQDAASCQAFVAARHCAGHFSWNIVFKRNY